MTISTETARRLAYGLTSQAAADEIVAVLDGETALASGAIPVGNASGVATDVVPTGDVTISNTGVTAIGAGKVTNAMVAPAALDGTVAKVQAADNVIGAIPVLFRIDIAAGALATKNVVMTHKVRVVDAWVVLRGAGVANTVLTVGNEGNIITNTFDVSGSDTAVVRCTTLNDANWEIAAGDDLRVVTTVGATQPACTVYVLAVRVA